MLENADHPVAVITGCGRRRLGFVIAQALARRGWAIGIHYHRSEQGAKALAAEFAEAGIPAMPMRADVTDEDQVRALVARVEAWRGRIDAWVNTASIWRPIALEEVTSQDILEDFRVNTLGTFLCCQHAGQVMVRQAAGGCIVNLGDWAIDRPYVDHATYFTAKGAIPTLTRVFAAELASRNPRVRVNCIHPGPVMFPADMTPAEQQAIVDATLLKSADDPQSIATAVEFLIDSPFVTGICVPVDGGRSIYAPSDCRS